MSYFRTSNTDVEQFFEFENKFSKMNQRIEELEADLEHKQAVFGKLLRDYGIQHSSSSSRQVPQLSIGDTPKSFLSTLDSLYDELQHLLSTVLSSSLHHRPSPSNLDQ